MTREQEAAGELANGLRDVFQGDPLVENARRVSKAVDTLQIVATVLAQEPDKGGTGGVKAALQDHLTQLKALSAKCSSRMDFENEAELHLEAFKLCKQLEVTPRRLAEAMNVNFEVLVDLNSSQAQAVAAHKKALLIILRNLGRASARSSPCSSRRTLDCKCPRLPKDRFGHGIAGRPPSSVWGAHGSWRAGRLSSAFLR